MMATFLPSNAAIIHIFAIDKNDILFPVYAPKNVNMNDFLKLKKTMTIGIYDKMVIGSNQHRVIVSGVRIISHNPRSWGHNFIGMIGSNFLKKNIIILCNWMILTFGNQEER